MVRYFFLICFATLSSFNSSCAPITRISGYIPPEIELSKLRIGSSTRQEVIAQLGEPLNSSDADSNFLLYIQKKVEAVAFLRPKIDNRKIVKLKFDNRSILSTIDVYDSIARKPFEIEKKIVISEGRKLTFWQQMFGNIGNFSSEQFLD